MEEEKTIQIIPEKYHFSDSNYEENDFYPEKDDYQSNLILNCQDIQGQFLSNSNPINTEEETGLISPQINDYQQEFMRNQFLKKETNKIKKDQSQSIEDGENFEDHD